MFELKKERLESMSDAIMAIIITIMALEIPINFTNGHLDYWALFNSVVIYFITFCFIGSIWYQHAFIYHRLDTVTSTMVINEFMVLFFLSIFPVCIKVMVEDVDIIWVVIYGVVNILINSLMLNLRTLVIRQEFKRNIVNHSFYHYMQGRIVREGKRIIGINAIAIFSGLFYPPAGMFLYLVTSTYSFFAIILQKNKYRTNNNVNVSQLFSYVQDQLQKDKLKDKELDPHKLAQKVAARFDIDESQAKKLLV